LVIFLKVRFIYPGAEWAYSKKRVESDPFSPPLGILYLASILENAGHDVTVTDFYAEPYTKQRLKEVLAGADLIGMTLTSFTMKDALPMAKAIKSMAPDVPFVVGGPHVTLYPTKSIDLTGADITVAGEAEDSILPLVKTISEGGPQDPRLKEITGVSFKTKDGIVSGPPGSYVKDLDTVPFPDRSLVKDYNYGHLLGSKISKGRFTTIITSRGCPMRCRFCTRMVVSMGKYRARSAENVIEEVKKVHEEGYETVMFVDDNFMALRKRTIKMLDGLIKADLGMEFIAQGRVDGVDDEVFTKMRKAGIRVLLLGIESGNQEVLDFYRKKTTLAQIEKCVRLARKYDIVTVGTIILGAPIETAEHFQKTVDFLKSIPLDLVHFFQLELAAGSPMWKEAVADGIITEDDYLVYVGKEKGYGKMTSDEIFKWVQKAHKDFYLRPGWWLDQIWQGMRRRDFRVIRTIRGAVKKKDEVFGT